MNRQTSHPEPAASQQSSTVQLTVRETTTAQLPPLPDPETYRTYFANPHDYMHAPQDAKAGHFQQIVLDLRTKDLFFHGEDWRVPREAQSRIPASGLFAPFHWLNVPDIIYWVIDSGIPVAERPYLTVDEGNAFAHQLAPLAQTLLDHLLPVPGTDALDWSAESASAGRDIEAACTRYQHPPKGRRPELVNMSEAVKACPEIVRPEWAHYTDARLDDTAEYLNRCGLHHHPAIAQALGFGPQTPRASLVGTRAWLYQNRRNAQTLLASQLNTPTVGDAEDTHS
ncbi:hypothetical protein JK359_33520 [Streptomyces actinomycinicus]|uniref:Uncharacterized protein n=1 Tax=Streptomyces actinomycinicus TaxID=1695166 RepID=A0A937ENZ0_9ACTN|nr:hypothetical protein [Streptomyces actinomycinicus]MBL1086827.1 hypothetical protein [Streptomyces actinomycinicus]